MAQNRQGLNLRGEEFSDSVNMQHPSDSSYDFGKSMDSNYVFLVGSLDIALDGYVCPIFACYAGFIYLLCAGGILMALSCSWTVSETIEYEIFQEGDILDGEFINDITFVECSWANLTLPNIIFNQCIFRKCDFSDAYFRDVQFIDCTLEDCKLDKVLWSDTSMEECKLHNCTFNEPTSMGGVEFSKCRLDGCEWKEGYSTFDTVSFIRCVFRSHSFAGFILKGYTFNNCLIYNSTFNSCDMSKSTIKNSSLDWIYFHDTSFDRTVLDTVAVKNSRISKCTFRDNVEIKSVTFTDVKVINTIIPLLISKNICINPTSEVSTETSIVLACPLTDKPLNNYSQIQNTYSPPAKPTKGKYRAYRFFTSEV